MKAPESPHRNPSAGVKPALKEHELPGGRSDDDTDERCFVGGIAAILLLPSRVFASLRRLLWRLSHPFTRPAAKRPARRSRAQRNTFNLSPKTTHHYAK